MATRELLIDLDTAGPGPMHERLTRALRGAIGDGTLTAGSVLPPSRALAADLGCSRWVVVQAYDQLIAEGYLTARTGSGTRVRWIDRSRPAEVGSAAGRSGRGRDRDAVDRGTQGRGTRRPGTSGPAATPATVPSVGAVGYDLAPGLPDLRAFPRRAWTEAIRSQLADLPYHDLGYPDPAGSQRLRHALADYLRRVRGARTEPDQVTVCAGVTDGLRRLGRAMLAAGIDRIAVEDPGWTRLRSALTGIGLKVVGVPVDDRGLRVAELDRLQGVRVVLLTPAHQFPTGVVLAPERRSALLDWVDRVDGLIVEDDYDAEFRYDRRPVGTMQGTDPSRVVLVGSVSKTLAPGLGLGWVVSPADWTPTLSGAEPAPSVLDQLGFAELVSTGQYDRVLRAARRRYHRRRNRLVDALQRELPDCPISGAAAGLHCILRLPGGRAGEVVRMAAERDLRVADLDRYRMTPDPTDSGLVIGYGNLADNAVEPAVAILSKTVEQARDSGVGHDLSS